MKFLSVFSVLALAASVCACSPNGSVTLNAIDVATQEVGNDTYVNFDATIKMGNLKFPNVEFPIINPVDLRVLGELTLANLPDGTNKLYYQLDYTATTHLAPGLGSELPNGRELPPSMGITSATAMIGIPILQGSRIYVGGDIHHDLYLGIALTISAFDGVFSQVGLPLDIFFSYPFSPTVGGYAGLFTGATALQNGIGVFVKKSMATAPPLPLTAKAMNRMVSAKTQTAPVQPSGGEEMGRLSNSQLIHLNRIFQKKAVLKIQ